MIDTLDFTDDGAELSEEELIGEYGVGGINYADLGVDPNEPTEAKPGSEEKVVMIAARYAAGLPLWHDEDCVEHGPTDSRDDDEVTWRFVRQSQAVEIDRVPAMGGGSGKPDIDEVAHSAARVLALSGATSATVSEETAERTVYFVLNSAGSGLDSSDVALTVSRVISHARNDFRHVNLAVGTDDTDEIVEFDAEPLSFD